MVLKAGKNNGQKAGGQKKQNQAEVIDNEGKVVATVNQNHNTAVTAGGKPSDLAALNPNLEGLDGIGDSNRVSVDGTEFEFKNSDSERREKVLNINVSAGRKVFQYWDENKTLCQSFDGKVSTDGLVCATCDHKKAKDCKFKFEVRWLELNEEEEPVEFIMTLPTVSAINFVNYVKSLSKEELGVHQVITQMTIERRINTSNNSKYSVVNFENVGSMEDDQE